MSVIQIPALLTLIILPKFSLQSLNIMLVVLLASLLSVSQISRVHAEAYWKPGSSTPPRNTDPFVNSKAAPCRDFTQTKRVRIFKPGDSILAQWSETRDHTGHFQFNLLQVNAGTGLEEFVMPVFPDVADSINGVITGTQFHEYQRNFILPTRLSNGTNIVTGNYVLQLIHLDKPLGTPANTPIAKYYSCSDIRFENINANDVTAPDNVSNYNLTQLSNSIQLAWTNPLSNGVATENLAYKVLVLQDETGFVNVTAAQLANSEYIAGDTVINQSTTAAYVGNRESVTISNTATKKIYFKIFSYDVNGNYSSGINFTGPRITLSIRQTNNQGTITDPSLLKVNNGNIVVTAAVSSNVANETFSFDWSQDNQSGLIDIDGVLDNASFVIDSSVLTAANYPLQLNIKSSSSGLISTVIQSLIVTNIASPTTPANLPKAKDNEIGGCTVGKRNTAFDPLLILLILISIVGIRKRRVKAYSKASS